MAHLFEPITIRGLDLKNRITVSPMCQYQSQGDGFVAPWHTVHYGSLALGGAALLWIESTAVEARGRISMQDLGLYQDEHIEGLSHIVSFAHSQGIRIGVQLGHAGRKADVEQAIVAPSPLQFSHHYKVPSQLTADQLDEVEEAFANAARRAVTAGFDTVEVHGAHGYLLHQFLSPISNQRQDEYGGNPENRRRFPLRVIRRVRSVIPEDMPLFIRVSGTEFVEEGYPVDEMVSFCQAFYEAGVDVIDVSGGGNVAKAHIDVYPGYQVPFAAAVKRGTGGIVSSVGRLEDPVLADSLIHEGRVDLVAVARGFLRDKHWGHSSALALGHPVDPPVPYRRAY